MSGKMIYLDLPNGQKMPIVGLGTWQATDEAELERAMDAALTMGYRHFDTAFAYENEAMLGKIFKKWFDSGKLKREDVFISTKLPVMGVHPDRVEFFMKKSLENLQMDYVDLYLIHFPGGICFDEKNCTIKWNSNGEVIPEGPTDQAALWKKMEEQVAAGRTKTIGLSNYNIEQITKILKTCKIKPANLQVELHIYLQQRDLVNFCHKNGITIVAYSPLGSPGFHVFAKQVGKEVRPDFPNILNDKVLKKVAEKHKKTPAQIVLRFLVQNGIAVIPKSVKPNRLEENFKLFDFQLDENDMKQLYDLDLGEKGRTGDWKVIAGIEKHPDYPFKC